MPGRPSQRDIARVAGISQSTVSIVLNGRADEYGIAAATRDKVREAMRQLGYVPDVAGRSLRGGRNGLIGVHTFERVFPVRSHDYYHEFLIGIEEKAVELGQDLVLFASTQGPDGTRSIYGAGANRLRLADGAIILGLERNDDELVRLAAEGFPFVFIGRRDVPGAQVPYVAADYAGAIADVVERLSEAGHTRAGYLGGTLRRGPQEERRAAFHRSRLAASPPVLVEAEAVTGRWLREVLTSATTALLVETFELAGAVAAAALAEGVEIPGDLSVVCLDLLPDSPATRGWSHIPVPKREMGARAVALLLDLLDGEIPADHHETVPCGPPVGTTIKPPR
ncbi:DNA-binding transcriptional regulator, LacI/PurR family [Nonomuraea solani]|uniref:DNA-binding transcriptional regulator, LacI/PurR family n=1 Tax=Nonomuraea solani TaxID=1144553 RepID=A0A1H6EFL9_9ACTN|nr:LacI family DNA-binding transcriptional regulator [Nonomuraea solani]SEG95776.1 DNA-binding transcriptional regulator, LacI/PurR family [Nonomuraea solani]